MPKLNHQLSAYATILAREPDNCTGWNCLTQAEQFGIILSIVVISIILILAYMYYLGKLTQAHRELVLATRHRRHRRRTPRTGPPLGIPGNQQLAIQTLPNYPPGFMCQPMICTPAGTSIPQPQPFLVPGYYPQPPPVPIRYSIPQQHPPTVHQPLNSFPARAPTGDFNNRNAQSDPSSPRDLPPRQPSWRQRLARAVGLPVGRASTISSSSESRTPRRSRSHSRTASENAGSRLEIRREAPVPTPNPTHSSTQPRRGSHDGISARSHDERVNPEMPASANELVSNIIERAQSTQTDAATVHSDDYEMIPNQIFDPPRRDASTSELHLPGTRSDQRTRVNDSSPKSDSSSDERFTVPSESSMQSDYSPDLRPTVSGSLYPESNSRLDGGPEHTKPMATVPISTSPIPRYVS